MENISQEIPRTDRAKECIFRASRGSTFLKIYCVSTILVVLLWVQYMYPSFLLKKTLDTPLFSFILLGIPSSLIFFVKNKRVGWQNVFADNPCYIKTLIVIPDWFFVFSWWTKEHPQKTFKYWSCRYANFQRPWKLTLFVPQYYTGRYYYWIKFTTAAKHSFLIN